MVFWMRHGTGIHNEAEAKLGTERWEAAEAKKDVYFDPELSAAGTYGSARAFVLVRVKKFYAPSIAPSETNSVSIPRSIRGTVNGQAFSRRV
jgi:hypothetical protein